MFVVWGTVMAYYGSFHAGIEFTNYICEVCVELTIALLSIS
jgi:hypothetical protein